MRHIVLLAALLVTVTTSAHGETWPNQWQWDRTDFTRANASPSEFLTGGPLRDGIPALDDPQFRAIKDVDYKPREPVIALEIDGEAKAYPLSILMWHEIANDTLGGVPVAVTFCPLCNAAIVYERKIDGEETTFGVSGILRKSDLVMYDRASHSWWQQFSGRGLVGKHMGKKLRRLPAKLISFSHFAKTYPNGLVLVPNNPAARKYGQNPYINYDRDGPFFDVYAKVPKGFERMDRVVVVGDTAWRMTSIAKAGVVEEGDLRLSWTSGQASALGGKIIGEGADIGSVIVEQRNPDGTWRVVNYDVIYAFVFASFKPDGKWRG